MTTIADTTCEDASRVLHYSPTGIQETHLESGSVITIRIDNDENDRPRWETYYQDASYSDLCSESQEFASLPQALRYHDQIAIAGT